MGNFNTPDSMVVVIFAEIAFIHAYHTYYIIYSNIFNGHHKKAPAIQEFFEQNEQIGDNAPNTIVFQTKFEHLD